MNYEILNLQTVFLFNHFQLKVNVDSEKMKKFPKIIYLNAREITKIREYFTHSLAISISEIKLNIFLLFQRYPNDTICF
jgi:hypothetical protein